MLRDDNSSTALTLRLHGNDSIRLSMKSESGVRETKASFEGYYDDNDDNDNDDDNNDDALGAVQSVPIDFVCTTK